MNDWDRYCLEEYEALMADDQDNDEPEDMLVLLFFIFLKIFLTQS